MKVMIERDSEETGQRIIVQKAASVKVKRIGKVNDPDLFYVIEATDDGETSASLYLTPGQAGRLVSELLEAFKWEKPIEDDDKSAAVAETETTDVPGLVTHDAQPRP